MPQRPDLSQLKRQAKELRAALRRGEVAAVREVAAHDPHADPQTFALHDAQRVLARSYGFPSWSKLRARVGGVTAEALCAAVEHGDHVAVRALLRRRPEIIELERPGRGEMRAIHVAVMRGDAAMVALLMDHGADPRSGIWPHRDATSARAMAIDRGLDEIVTIIRSFEARASGRDAARPARASTEPFATNLSAVALGEAAWVKERHARGLLTGPTTFDPCAPIDGLVSAAVRHDRPEMLRLLLDLGFDPDERLRVAGSDDAPYSWGRPLMLCCGKPERRGMAKLLLERGADPNGQVCASGTPVSRAYGARDTDMVDLLVQHGGVVPATCAGYFRDTDLARRLFEEEDSGRLAPGAVEPGATLGETLLESGASGGDPEIVEMALARITWARDDPRWFRRLWDTLVFWNHRPGLPTADPSLPRDTYLRCFELILSRCDPSALVDARFGQTILHEIAAMGTHVSDAECLELASRALARGVRTDVRDELLGSTALGWAARWGRAPLVRLLVARGGADPSEPQAAAWARPRAWAVRRGNVEVVAALDELGGSAT